MSTMKLKLDLDKSLTVDSDNKLTVNISSESGNTLEIKSDGLYAESNPGQSSSGGSRGYTGRSFCDNIRVGYEIHILIKRLNLLYIVLLLFIKHLMLQLKMMKLYCRDFVKLMLF